MKCSRFIDLSFLGTNFNLNWANYWWILLQVNFKIPRVPMSSFLSTRNFAAILPGDSVAGLVVANGINNFLNIYNTLLVVRLVLTWFPNSPPAIVNPLRYYARSFLTSELAIKYQ